MAFGLVHPVALDGEHDDVGHPEDADVEERETEHEAFAVEGGGVGDEPAVQAGHHPEKAQKVDKSAVHEAQHEGAGKGEYQQEKPAEIAHISLLEKQGAAGQKRQRCTQLPRPAGTAAGQREVDAVQKHHATQQKIKRQRRTVQKPQRQMYQPEQTHDELGVEGQLRVAMGDEYRLAQPFKRILVHKTSFWRVTAPLSLRFPAAPPRP